MKKNLSTLLAAIALLAFARCFCEPSDGVLDAGWIAGEIAGFAVCFGACWAARKLNSELFNK